MPPQLLLLAKSILACSSEVRRGRTRIAACCQLPSASPGISDGWPRQRCQSNVDPAQRRSPCIVSRGRASLGREGNQGRSEISCTLCSTPDLEFSVVIKLAEAQLLMDEARPRQTSISDHPSHSVRSTTGGAKPARPFTCLALNLMAPNHKPYCEPARGFQRSQSGLGATASSIPGP